MSEFLELLASGLYQVVPGFVRLPSLTFVMPHTLYWLGLFGFPLIAMYLCRREAQNNGSGSGRVAQPIAWIFWLSGGFVGLHRFYLRAALPAVAYITLFLGVLYGNRRTSDSRELISVAREGKFNAEFDLEDVEKAIEAGIDGAAEKLTQAKQALVAAVEKFDAANATFDMWGTFSGTLALVILAMLLFDAVHMGKLTRRCLEIEAKLPPRPQARIIERPMPDGERDRIHTPATTLIGKINGHVGQFIAFWSVIAVAVYYYEVVARYVFNSPTNWAHESMFLMFGMQYLLSGGFALRDDSHVRVDVLYEQCSEHTKAVIDVVTSFFFFIFTVTLLVTGWIFAADSIDVWEVSFTEWAIQYWPVKSTLVIGAVLLIAQGIAKLIKDVSYLRGVRA